MKGLRLIILLKDDKIKKLQIANGGELMQPTLKQLQGLPLWVTQHINILEGEKMNLTKKLNEKIEEIRYLRKVEREQSKALLEGDMSQDKY